MKNPRKAWRKFVRQIRDRRDGMSIAAHLVGADKHQFKAVFIRPNGEWITLGEALHAGLTIASCERYASL